MCIFILHIHTYDANLTIGWNFYDGCGVLYYQLFDDFTHSPCVDYCACRVTKSLLVSAQRETELCMTVDTHMDSKCFRYM